MSHHHYQVNRRGALIEIDSFLQNPAHLNSYTGFGSTLRTVSLGYFYACDNTLLLHSAYLVSDSPNRHINHNHLLYVHPRSINLNRVAAVVPPRRGNNESHGTFLRQMTVTEVEQILQGQNFRESDESPSFMHRNWREEEETMILEGFDQVGGSSEEINVGVSDEVMSKYLRTRHWARVIRATDEDDEPEICVVCQDVLFEENQTITALKCGHEFHTPCITTWLRRKNECPLCKSIALPYR